MSESWEEKKAREARQDHLVAQDIAKVKAQRGRIVSVDLSPEEVRLVQVYRNGSGERKRYYLEVMVQWEYTHRYYCGPTLSVVTNVTPRKPAKRSHKAPELQLV